MPASLFDISGVVPLSQTSSSGKAGYQQIGGRSHTRQCLEHSPAHPGRRPAFHPIGTGFRASSNGLLAALKSERLLSDLHRGGPAALAAHPVSTRACREHPCQLRSIAAIPARRNDRG